MGKAALRRGHEPEGSLYLGNHASRMACSTWNS
jgi:hypothetical protein